jgi:hypothetical protein
MSRFVIDKFVKGKSLIYISGSYSKSYIIVVFIQDVLRNL